MIVTGLRIRLLMAIAFAGLSSASAQEKATVQGEIVDLTCYMVAEGGGSEYESCAQLGSRRKAISIGVVTDRGELLLLVNQSADWGPYEAAQRLTGAHAELTGRTVRKSGVSTLIVESAEGL